VRTPTSSRRGEVDELSGFPPRTACPYRKLSQSNPVKQPRPFPAGKNRCSVPANYFRRVLVHRRPVQPPPAPLRQRLTAVPTSACRERPQKSRALGHFTLRGQSARGTRAHASPPARCPYPLLISREAAQSLRKLVSGESRRLRKQQWLGGAAVRALNNQ